MLVTPKEMVALQRLPQPLKAKSPMLVTLAGIVIEYKLLQLANAQSQMRVSHFVGKGKFGVGPLPSPPV